MNARQEFQAPVIKAHPHAEILRGMADGHQVLVKPPYEDDFIPLDSASSTATHALLRPQTIVNPGIWLFKIKENSHD